MKCDNCGAKAHKYEVHTFTPGTDGETVYHPQLCKQCASKLADSVKYGTVTKLETPQ